jgi:nitrogen fixation/metabolism regulation signal transduction histidine kinase
MKIDTSFWQLHSLSLLDGQGNPVWKYDFDSPGADTVDPRILAEFRTPERRSLVVSDREANQFTAVVRMEPVNTSRGFLVLQASMQMMPLLKADSLLNTRQIYQTLDFKRDHLIRSFAGSFILIFVILLVLVILLGIWISARLTSPFSQLVTATAEIGKGNLDYRLPVSSRGDEVGQLIFHFNAMTRQLKENQQRLIYLEKMAAWQQMARKMAHEIKNPLTPIQLTIQQLVDKYDGSNREYQSLLQECFEIIQDEIGSLRRLVSEFSEFGRMPELQMTPGNVNELIREVAALYSGRLQLELDEKIPDFSFDEDRLRRLLINLIENAIQADPGNQPVTIQTEKVKDRLVIKVQDRGQGIPVENIDKIFEPYFSTKKGSMGLGLAISRLIVEEHGGTIRVESEINKGSTFNIDLPVHNLTNQNNQDNQGNHGHGQGTHSR